MKRIRILLLIITLAIIALSIILSGQTANDSTLVSDRILRLFNIVTAEQIASKSSRYYSYSQIFREVAHVVLFALISVPVFLLSYSFIKNLRWTIPFTLVVVMGYALFDELRQETVEGRTFEYFDLVMDFIGCSLSVFISTSAVWTTRRIVKKIYEVEDKERDLQVQVSEE